MKTNRIIDDILNNCLEKILIERVTVEQCLKSYSEEAGELEPLLHTALLGRRALAIRPREEFRARARYQFHSALKNKSNRKRLSFLGRVIPSWATALAIILVLSFAGGGSIIAATNSMPDNPLYPVKLITEQVRINLAQSELERAEVYTELADRRVTEIIYLATKGDAGRVDELTQQLDKELVMLASLSPAITSDSSEKILLAPAPGAAPTPVPEAAQEAEAEVALSRAETAISPEENDQAKLRLIIAHNAVGHPAALRAELENTPESARPALMRAIAVSMAGYSKALESFGLPQNIPVNHHNIPNTP